MHLHGHSFQVVAIAGNRFAGALRDTVLVPPKTTSGEAGVGGKIEGLAARSRYSDIADALQYAFIGVGEGRAMIGMAEGSHPRPVKTLTFGGKRTPLGGRKVG